jgi:hypothetical protein
MCVEVVVLMLELFAEPSLPLLVSPHSAKQGEFSFIPLVLVLHPLLVRELAVGGPNQDTMTRPVQLSSTLNRGSDFFSFFVY